MPRWLRSPWVRAALGGAAWTGLVLWIASGGKKSAPSGGVVRAVERLGADPIPLVTGATYAGAIVTHRGANAAGHDAVVSAAAKRGFADVVASDRPIDGWPWTTSDADWYVVAKYTGAPHAQPRSEGGVLGSAEVVEAMREVTE